MITRDKFNGGRLSASLVLIGAALSAQVSVAANYYVATNGEDTNAGTLAAPLKTIGKAQTKIKPGDTIFIRGGVYVEAVRLTVSGTAFAPIKLRAYKRERPVLDGQMKLAPKPQAMLNVLGNHIQVSGLEIKNGLGQGVRLRGHHNRLSNCKVHHNASGGVSAQGDYSVVEYTQSWWNSWEDCQLSTCTPDPNGGAFGTGITASRDPVDGVTDYAILRGNTVFNNWGEGLSTFEANGTLIENNVVYDNYNINLYISDATNVVASGNVVYTSPNPAVGRHAPAGIGMSDEIGKPRSKNIRIVNNFVKGGIQTLAWWTDPDFLEGCMDNVLIAHNTFIEAAHTAGWAGSVNLRPGNHQRVRFVNNIVSQTNAVQCIKLGTGDIQFGNNLWSKPVVAAAQSVDDIIADPQLALIGSSEAGQVTGDYFKLTADSPAIDRGSLLSDVLADFFGDARDVTPDIGGDEF